MTSTPTRRGMLGAMAAITGLALPSLPVLAAPPAIASMVPGGAWKASVAEYRAAKEAHAEAERCYKAVEASCRRARGKIIVPPGLRSCATGAMGWFDMTVAELRADMMVRRQGPDTPRKIKLVEKDLEGVPQFRRQLARANAPMKAAWKRLDEATVRFGKAEDAIRRFQVTNIVDLAEKMAIARDDDSGWIIEGVHHDIDRLAGGNA